ncbi:MAG TPA: anti-sigma factor [Polaromonas sp.]|uniref:anti-sigma factor n=1 Tax=Polaromonas sp. TaxID=1869339 RepID=UPI002D2C0D23|nr:anti-sigma factor [Polaromonas sp.]HYW58112.1 anti-sigma factor [Polaromonas sp.]
MNLISNPSLIDQLGASYALGTLRGGARRRFEALARVHAPVRAAALIWQSRLASVTELQPQLAPSPAVWKRIQNLVDAEKEAKRMLAARQTPVAASGGWWASLGLWRGATAAGAMAAVVAVVTGVNLNSTLNGQVQDLSAKLSATPEIQYVAVLADDKAAASMLVTFDPKNNKLVLKRVGGFQESADKSLELWALPKSGGPKSLGVMSSEKIMRLTATDRDVREVPALAITLEPKGGVPPGSGPTGPVLFKGALIQTTL